MPQDVLVQNECLKTHIKALYENLEYLQQENTDLKSEHEKEIILLQKEVMELKEKLDAKTAATNETNGNLSFVHFLVNSSELENFRNTEITVMEKPLRGKAFTSLQQYHLKTITIISLTLEIFL